MPEYWIVDLDGEGVPEYWMADFDSRCIERWRPGATLPERSAETLEWNPTSASHPLVIELAELWEITAQ